jgi:long-subunit acyl-CoA synthetase (AMP-forming)
MGKYSRFLHRYFGEREMNSIMLSKKASIIFNGNIISYNDLLVKTNLIISLLQAQAQAQEIEKNVFGIAMHRSPDLIMAILAAIYLKTPFVLIDIDLPSDRLNQIYSSANTTTIITMHDVNMQWSDINKIYIDNMDLISSQKPIAFERYDDVMYILFTSGSAGTPKGVEVLYDGFINFVDGITEIIDFSPLKRIACFTTASFDIFFLESIMAL